MPGIVIENLDKKTLEIRDFDKTLLQHFQTYQLDWMHACGGKGRCTTCKVIVRDGEENLSPITVSEQRYRAQNALKPNERLSCQAKTRGNITISVPDEYKLPHIKYSG